MLAKNLPLSKKIFVIPARFILDGITAWRGLLSGQGSYFVAILKAQFSFINWWLFHQTKSNFPITKKGHLYGFFPKSIAWQFFIKKKRTFPEIVTKTT
jgi:hypothetical protein